MAKARKYHIVNGYTSGGKRIKPHVRSMPKNCRVQFTPKAGGSEPMELADMMSRDLFEWVRSGCTGKPKRWELFSDKIYCRGDGGRGKFGVKIFPDSDVRELIEAHRIRCGAAA